MVCLIAREYSHNEFFNLQWIAILIKSGLSQFPSVILSLPALLLLQFKGNSMLKHALQWPLCFGSDNGPSHIWHQAIIYTNPSLLLRDTFQ